MTTDRCRWMIWNFRNHAKMCSLQKCNRGVLKAAWAWPISVTLKLFTFHPAMEIVTWSQSVWRVKCHWAIVKNPIGPKISGNLSTWQNYGKFIYSPKLFWCSLLPDRPQQCTTLLSFLLYFCRLSLKSLSITERMAKFRSDLQWISSRNVFKYKFDGIHSW